MVVSDGDRTSSAPLEVLGWVTGGEPPVTSARAPEAGASSSRAATATAPVRLRIDSRPMDRSSARGTEELESIRGRPESDVALKFRAARPTIRE